MTLQTIVFFDSENLPELKTLQIAIRDSGFDFKLPDNLYLTSSTPILAKGEFEGLESCFDYVFHPYREQDWTLNESDQGLVKKSNVISFFNVNSNAQEVVGMLVTASVLATVTHGVMLSEFFSDNIIPSKYCIEFAKETIEEARMQFNGPSNLRN